MGDEVGVRFEPDGGKPVKVLPTDEAAREVLPVCVGRPVPEGRDESAGRETIFTTPVRPIKDAVTSGG